MTGHGDEWGSWKIHPSLQQQWDELEALCSGHSGHPDVAKLCMKLLKPSVPHECKDDVFDDDFIKSDHGEGGQLFPMSRTSQEDSSSQLSQAFQTKSQGPTLLSQCSQEYDTDSLLNELVEILESQNIPLPDELQDALSELDPQAYPKLLKQLRDQLSSDGLHTLCTLASECVEKSIQENNWLHPALICKYIFLPKVQSTEECPNELIIIMEEFAQSCPMIVIIQILQPILKDDGSVAVQRDLVQRVISTLPAQHHVNLVKFVLDRCDTPLQISKIIVLLTLLRSISADLTQVLSKIMALLENSAESLSRNEQFADLLLIIVRRLPPNTPQPVRDLLGKIIRQNESFNRQILLNALKEKT